ncbi:hypothetical protein [Micrococcus luteus]|uniref:hypothetical protein n=1 Tax=Micrococcus luteus TaxID=1270 RepID=UPI00363C008E
MITAQRLRALLLALAAMLAITAVTAPGASAETVGLQEWLAQTTDSHGVPLDHYQTLPLDRGGLLDPILSMLAGVMSFIWGLHYSLVTSLLWLLQYLLSFEWVSLIVDPIQPMAEQVQAMLSGLNWVPFAATVAGATIGLLFVSGRRNQGWGELVLSVAMVMLATGALMNPVTWITGPGGMLEKSQLFGARVAVEIVGGDSSQISTPQDASTALNETVMTDLGTLLLRNPAQTSAFGHILDGQCAQVFTDATRAADPMDTSSTDVRDAVSDCDEAAKSYVSSEDFFKPAQMLFIGGGVLVLLVLGFALALIFIVSVLLAMFYGIWQMAAVLIAILPGTSRTSFLRAFFGVLACMAAIITTTVLTAAAVNLLVSVLEATTGLGVVLQMMILFLVTVAVIVLVFKLRNDLHKKGKSMADWVARLGLSKTTPTTTATRAKFPRGVARLGEREFERRRSLRFHQDKRAADATAWGQMMGAYAWARGTGQSRGEDRSSSAGGHPSSPRSGPHYTQQGPDRPHSTGHRGSRPAPRMGTAALTAGKAVMRRRVGPMGKGSSVKGRAIRLAGLAAGTFGGPAGTVAMFGADYMAERADQHHRGRRIAVDSQGRGHVIPATTVVQGEIIDDAPRQRPPRQHPLPPSPRLKELTSKLDQARKG